ncbi:MAG TPA: hypothetical protein DDW76_13295 [Cyanobacteria bacterium UBA11369]|nr:hypothetical protein [Cyanobacteria bacterium UBA11371]HBE35239.1 hypothetical protein [Cyanobacteria bacterium UBA11368]HBE49733.1 hypothetical protein [Cyanobacteria bacterium UBA11369]
MQRTFLYLGKVLRKIFLVVSLISLLSLSGLSIFNPQPSLAAAYKDNSPVLEKGSNSQSVKSREDAYEKAIKAIDEPEGLEKVYEKNLDKYEKENPQPGIIESAKEVIKEVTQPE